METDDNIRTPPEWKKNNKPQSKSNLPIVDESKMPHKHEEGHVIRCLCKDPCNVWRSLNYMWRLHIFEESLQRMVELWKDPEHMKITKVQLEIMYINNRSIIHGRVAEVC